MRQLVAGPDHEPHAFAECKGSKLWRVFDSRSNEPSECLPNEQRNCAVATDWLLRKMQHIFSYRTSWEMHSPKILGDTFNQWNNALKMLFIVQFDQTVHQIMGPMTQ